MKLMNNNFSRLLKFRFTRLVENVFQFDLKLLLELLTILPEKKSHHLILNNLNATKIHTLLFFHKLDMSLHKR